MAKVKRKKQGGGYVEGRGALSSSEVSYNRDICLLVNMNFLRWLTIIARGLVLNPARLI